MPSNKIYAGPRIRRARTRLGLTQTRMAADLGISASYLNLIESNQRPLTVPVLMRLSAIHGIDAGELRSDDDAGAMSELREIFSDPLLAGELPSADELVDALDTAPNVMRGLARLHGAYREALHRLSDLSQDLAGTGGTGERAGGPQRSADKVADWIEEHGPWFPELEAAAAQMSERLGPMDDRAHGLRTYLQAQHATDVRILPARAMPNELARFDRHSMRLFISERVPHSRRALFIATHLARVDQPALLDRLAGAVGADEEVMVRQVRIQLARAFASAICVPAPRLAADAAELQMDIAHLAQRFSVPQSVVMERIAILGTADDNPIPRAFLLCLDKGGSILRRLAIKEFPFPRMGAICTRLPAFDPLRIGEIRCARLLTSDRTEFLAVATLEEGAAEPGGEGRPQLISMLGFRAGDAGDTIYARRASQITRPIGTSCRLCDHTGCTHRIAPAVTQATAMTDYVTGPSAVELF